MPRVGPKGGFFALEGSGSASPFHLVGRGDADLWCQEPRIPCFEYRWVHVSSAGLFVVQEVIAALWNMAHF